MKYGRVLSGRFPKHVRRFSTRDINKNVNVIRAVTVDGYVENYVSIIRVQRRLRRIPCERRDGQAEYRQYSAGPVPFNRFNRLVDVSDAINSAKLPAANRIIVFIMFTTVNTAAARVNKVNSNLKKVENAGWASGYTRLRNICA